MPRVSWRKLDKEIEAEMFRQFWNTLSKLKHPNQIASFFSDLLTDTEEVMLAKRFTIALLLLKGRRPVDIAMTLHVSYSAIGSAAAWMKNAKPATKALLESLIEDTRWEALMDRFDELLDNIGPRYGSNWSRAGQEKWQRKKERATRRALR